MRAVVIETIQGPPAVQEVADPVAPAEGVVVRVLATGMCRSDWHAWAGHEDVALPHIPGHELAGVVVEVGSAVQRWRHGDRVTVPFVCGCGRCRWCREGQAQVCPRQQQPGFTYWGSFAEYVVLHAADANLVAVPEQMELTTAAALGCRFATAYRALVGRGQVREHEWVTVLGTGGVGLSTVMIATALGARVIPVDRHPEALARARELGAVHTLNVDTDDVPAAVAELSGGGSHIAVDAVGSEQSCAASIHSLRRHARHLQIGLLPAVPEHPRVPMDRVIAWELELLGSHGMAAADYPDLLRLVAQGTLRPQSLVERVIGLHEAAELLPRFDRAPIAGMTMIDPGR